MKIIVLDGPSGSGKSALARVIKELSTGTLRLTTSDVTDSKEANRAVALAEKKNYDAIVLACQKPLDEKFEHPIYARFVLAVR